MGLAGKSPLGSDVRAAWAGGLGEGQSQAGGLEAVAMPLPPTALRLQPSVQGCRLMKRAAFRPSFFFFFLGREWGQSMLGIHLQGQPGERAPQRAPRLSHLTL